MITLDWGELQVRTVIDLLTKRADSQTEMARYTPTNSVAEDLRPMYLAGAEWHTRLAMDLMRAMVTATPPPQEEGDDDLAAVHDEDPAG